jgi:hypothetical protein
VGYHFSRGAVVAQENRISQVSAIFCRACCLNAHICSTIEIINGIMYWTLGMSIIPLRLVDPMSNFSNRNGATYNVSSVSL